jgi:hypothetical protein
VVKKFIFQDIKNFLKQFSNIYINTCKEEKYYKMSNLTKFLAPIALMGGLAGSVDAADYAKVNKFLGWETTTVTRTQSGVVYIPQKVIYTDACGNSCVGVGYTPRAAEIITGQCTNVHWNPRDSIPGRAIGLLNGIGKEVEKAISPRPATTRPCIPYDRCSSMYIAPPRVQYAPALVPVPCEPCR